MRHKKFNNMRNKENLTHKYFSSTLLTRKITTSKIEILQLKWCDATIMPEAKHT